MRPIRPFWRYYGGKWRAVSRGMYPEPRHDVIVEPFAGAAGFACNYPDRDVVLVERDPKVAAIWKWLIAATPADVLALPPTIDRDVREFGLPDGPTWLLGFWCGNARQRPGNVPSAWLRSSGTNAWGPDVRARVADGVARIKHWTIIEGDYTVAPDVEATWFVDPPYAGIPGAAYTFGSKLLDYAALGAWCLERRGSVIVCEGGGADWLPFGSAFRNQAAPVAGKSSNVEVMWTRDADAQAVLL